jgi:hypothetical protein
MSAVAHFVQVTITPGIVLRSPSSSTSSTSTSHNLLFLAPSDERCGVAFHPMRDARVIHRNSIRTPNCSNRRQIAPLTESCYAPICARPRHTRQPTARQPPDSTPRTPALAPGRPRHSLRSGCAARAGRSSQHRVAARKQRATRPSERQSGLSTAGSGRSLARAQTQPLSHHSIPPSVYPTPEVVSP